MPQPARFHVIVRFAGRIVDDRCWTGALSLGDGGDVVVPGLGDARVLVRGDRVLPVDGLAGAITTTDALQPFESLDAEGLVLAEGERAELRSIAHPELTVEVERIAAARVRMRDRVSLVPGRETVFAGAIAGCLATLLGGKVVIGALTEPEQLEREKTALELAMYDVAPIIPVGFLPRPVIVVEPEPLPEPVHAATRVPVPSAMADGMSTRANDGVDAPLALPDAEAKPRKRSPRRRRPAPEHDAVLALTGELAMSDVVWAEADSVSELRALGTVRDEAAIFGVLDESAFVDGIDGGGPGGVVGGVPGGTPEAEPQKLDHRADEPLEEVVRPSIAVAPTPIETGDAAIAAVPSRPPADPRDGKFTLADAFAGDATLAKGAGTLTAIIDTNKGKITCELFEQRTPNTVANFVGLARGKRPWLDPESLRWTKAPLYDGVTFHRVIDGFMIQGGDPLGTGKGGPGYEIADELDPALHFDRAGVLAMANRGPNTAGSQFFVSVAAARHLDGKHTVFGQCDEGVVQAIAKVPVDDAAQHRPREAVVIRGVEIVRVAVEPEPAPGTGTEAPALPAPTDTLPPAG